MLLPSWLRKRRPASLADIRRSFNEAAADEEHFPSTIDPRIAHVRLLLEVAGDLGSGRILDVGCGKGRFARVLKEHNRQARITGIDLSDRMLQNVPAGIERCLASMTQLPFADRSFDAAYATESLEHAVAIKQAVAEICRVVKPGGVILVIDKNAEHWGRLKTPEWERWFRREELESLLGKHCRQVSSRFLSYWEDVPPDGMFLAWLARK